MGQCWKMLRITCSRSWIVPFLTDIQTLYNIRKLIYGTLGKKTRMTTSIKGRSKIRRKNKQTITIEECQKLKSRTLICNLHKTVIKTKIDAKYFHF